MTAIAESLETDLAADMRTEMRMLGQAAKAAAGQIAAADTGAKNAALTAIGRHLHDNRAAILRANQKDLKLAAGNGLSDALTDRLALDEKRIASMADGCRAVAALPDPVGAIGDLAYRPSGIRVGKMRVPLGVIGIIYESRPNVTIDAAVLCIKAGNAVILRGGSEAIYSNLAIAQSLHAGLAEAGLAKTAVQLVATTERAAVGELLAMDEYIDVIVPRGGKDLVARVSREATVPVIRHFDGVCHVYIDTEADLQMAVEVAYNAKARRYGICGAMETLLIANEVAATVLPQLAQRYWAAGIELRGCEKSREIMTRAKVDAEANAGADGGEMKAADEDDWRAEYLDAILSVKVVDGLDEAIWHINHYGSHHTDAIVTNSLACSRRFLREVDSSSVMVNASTQFADGYEYGLGAEIGISTDKLHVRGPVGLEGLTCQKFVVIGEGNVRE